MADLSTPLNWKAQPGAAAAAAESPAKEKGSRDAFLWPTPPYASYPAPTEQTETLPCQIVVRAGLAPISARLTFFVPETSVAHVQMPSARTTLALRFDKFAALTVTTPLRPLPLSRSDPHAALLGERQTSPYKIQLAAGGELSGMTIGHVEAEFGLFIFPPCEDDGSVKRTFLPRAAYTAFELGPKIGEVLVDQQRATPAQIDEAVDVQKGLRKQKLGEMLVTQQIVSAQQLLEAIERQQKMPLVRIGEALLSLGMIDEGQLKEALVQQQLDRS
ncbi:MAG TPA: pilus assembly protein PilB, partial [Caldimonas sp.]|nr:pilus assembly protein PilB [Caldimonas sp.]